MPNENWELTHSFLIEFFIILAVYTFEIGADLKKKDRYQEVLFFYLFYFKYRYEVKIVNGYIKQALIEFEKKSSLIQVVLTYF